MASRLQKEILLNTVIWRTEATKHPQLYPIIPIRFLLSAKPLTNYTRFIIYKCISYFISD